MRRPSAGTLAGLAVLISVAAVTRGHGLSAWAFDGDELYSYYDVQTLLSGTGLPDGVRSYPLGYLLMAASAALFGLDEFGLRLAAALSSVAAVALLVLLRRDAVPLPVAAVASALATLSPWLIFHGQEARFYAPLLLFATAATLLILPGPGRRPLTALLCALLAAACHPSAGLLAACLAGLLLAERTRPAVLVAACVACAAGGLVFVFLSDLPLALVLREALLRRGPSNYGPVAYIAGLGYNLGPVTGLLALRGLPWPRPARGDPRRVLVVLAVVPPLLLLVPSLLGVSVQQRYAMASVPALLLLAGHGLVALRSRPLLAGVAGAAALLVPLPETVNLWRNGDRADMRAAADWLALNSRPEHILVADEHALLDLYLWRHPDFDGLVSHEAPLDAMKQWGFLRNRQEVWVVLKASRMRGAYGAEFIDWITRHFERVMVIGDDPPWLARHDNRLFIYRRSVRIVDPPGSDGGPPPRDEPPGDAR